MIACQLSKGCLWRLLGEEERLLRARKKQIGQAGNKHNWKHFELTQYHIKEYYHERGKSVKLYDTRQSVSGRAVCYSWLSCCLVPRLPGCLLPPIHGSNPPNMGGIGGGIAVCLTACLTLVVPLDLRSSPSASSTAEGTQQTTPRL